MKNPAPPSSDDDDVFVTTGKGNVELKAAGTLLSAAELQLLVLVDGFSSVAQIAKRLPEIGREQVSVALRKLVGARLIVSTGGPETDAMGSGFSTIAVPAGFFSGLTMNQNPEADGGASILKKKGYYVRIARRPTVDRDARDGSQPTILVIDDDPDLQKLIRTYFLMEGFVPRAAFKRDEIAIALRQQPPPDLILLDVNLPDANGFEILARMREHAVLKNMPVVMFTAEATRESVLKGLQLGADGYITKPFEPDVLVAAVKAVLGLTALPASKKK